MKNQMWNQYDVEVKFVDKLCGSVPLSKEVIRGWLDGQKPASKPVGAKSIEELAEEVEDTIRETEDRITLGFQSDGQGLFIRDGVVKAHLKDCANQVKGFLAMKSLRSAVANKLYVQPARIYLTKESKNVCAEDGDFERAVHIVGPGGPRNALKRIRYVVQPVVTFELLVLNDNALNTEVLQAVFDYGSIHGLGGERGMGEGKYTFSLVESEE